MPPDTTDPVVIVPGDMTAEATGPSGAIVSYSASASDDVDGVLTPTCLPVSGGTFPLGDTLVTCSATDAASNTGSAAFHVLVVDTTGPLVTVPADITTPATGPSGATGQLQRLRQRPRRRQPGARLRAGLGQHLRHHRHPRHLQRR